MPMPNVGEGHEGWFLFLFVAQSLICLGLLCWYEIVHQTTGNALGTGYSHRQGNGVARRRGSGEGGHRREVRNVCREIPQKTLQRRLPKGPRALGGLEPAVVGSRRRGKGIYRTAAYPGGIRLNQITKEMTGTKGNGAELFQIYNSAPLVFPTGTPGS